MNTTRWLIIVAIQILYADASNWTEFVSEIQNVVNNSRKYVLPTNNNAYFVSSDGSELNKECESYGTYDFIIAGGGTAGGVLANRLSEIRKKNFTVLVVEAGQKPPDWAVVLGLAAYLTYSDYNFGYNTTVQKHACLGSLNQRCFYPRGKCLGGSSCINGGAYVRGNAKDYDKWQILGNKGWSFKDCLPYFKKSEHADFFGDMDRQYHGLNGPQHINIPPDTEDLTKPLLDAFVELNKTKGDYNGESQDRVSRMQSYIDYNIRADTFHAFIRPVENRTNLYITLGSLVTKIQLDGSEANGVEFVKNGRKYCATARKEVIVSAGAINSPQILMLSGIGSKKELQRHNIKIHANLPAVGKYLKDHVQFKGLIWRTNGTFYNTSLLQNLELWKQGKRPLTANHQIVSFWNYEGPGNSEPEVEVFADSASSALSSTFNDDYAKAFQLINSLTDINIGISLLHPKSSGTVTLQSNDPRDYPIIDPNFLSDERDVETIYKSVLTVLQLNDTKAFQQLNAQFLLIPMPGCDGVYSTLSKDWWFCVIRQISNTVFHPVGTTRMGLCPNSSVVNNRLKIHGFKNLRVVDAGVIPSTTSGHTNAPVVMIAEKIADDILAEHGQSTY